MDKNSAIAALSALGQETRLDVFRHLVTVGSEGMGAGDLAEALDVRANTLSTHLAALSRAGLIAATREGRTIRYRAHYDGIRALFDFLLHDCCKGRPELCGPYASTNPTDVTKVET
jgi:ArsR family transcriptional regulator